MQKEREREKEEKGMERWRALERWGRERRRSTPTGKEGRRGKVEGGEKE